MTPIFSVPIIIDNINKHLLSENRFDRHIQTRVDIIELFLRVAFKAGSELLYAVARIPLATIKWVLNQVNHGHLLTASLNFSEIIAHLKQSKQCTAALVCDFPAIFINPKEVQTRLLNRHLIHVEIPQPKPTLFESLAKHIWTRQAALMGTTAAVFTTAVVIHRLGLLNPPSPNPNPPQTAPVAGFNPLVLILPVAGTSILLWSFKQRIIGIITCNHVINAYINRHKIIDDAAFSYRSKEQKQGEIDRLSQLISEHWDTFFRLFFNIKIKILSLTTDPRTLIFALRDMEADWEDSSDDDD